MIKDQLPKETQHHANFTMKLKYLVNVELIARIKKYFVARIIIAIIKL